MIYDVVTIGDASEDVFIQPSEMKVAESRAFGSGKMMSFELGDKIPIEDVDYAVGGSATNIAVGLARMGLKSSVVAVVGEDSPGEKVLKCLAKEGVDDSNVIVKKEMKTNFSVIFNTKDGERTIFVYHGLKDYREIKVKKSLSARWFFLAPIGDHSEEIETQLITFASEKNTFIAWNPGSIQIREGASHHRNLLKNTTVLFLNREEAIKFTNYPVRPKEEEVMKRLHGFGVKTVVITNGKEGAKAYDGDVFYHLDVLPDSKRVDATGAGDSFGTAFLGKLVDAGFKGDFDKELISEALKYGMVNSGSVVSEIGAQKGLLSVREIEEGISKHPRLQVEVY